MWSLYVDRNTNSSATVAGYEVDLIKSDPRRELFAAGRDDDGGNGDDGRRTDREYDTIYAYELKVVVMSVIYVAFRLCDYNLYVCPALRNETCF